MMQLYVSLLFGQLISQIVLVIGIWVAVLLSTVGMSWSLGSHEQIWHGFVLFCAIMYCILVYRTRAGEYFRWYFCFQHFPTPGNKMTTLPVEVLMVIAYCYLQALVIFRMDKSEKLENIIFWYCVLSVIFTLYFLKTYDRYRFNLVRRNIGIVQCLSYLFVLSACISVVFTYYSMLYSKPEDGRNPKCFRPGIVRECYFRKMRGENNTEYLQMCSDYFECFYQRTSTYCFYNIYVPVIATLGYYVFQFTMLVVYCLKYPEYLQPYPRVIIHDGVEYPIMPRLSRCG